MTELQKVTDPTKIVTDPVMLAALLKQGMDKDYVEMVQDYGRRVKGVSSPYATFYRDLKSDRCFMVVNALPMVDAWGQPHELAWRDRNGVIENGNNIFHCTVKKGDISLAALSDQPWGAKKNEDVGFHPQLFIGGSEVQPVSLTPKLLETDPMNENYHNNVLEWDYGVCRRRLRLIEGRFLGSWVFLTSPGGDVLIKYNQRGGFRLRLQHARGDDEEFIPLEYFEGREFPALISDSATFYPDANPETSSVDGHAGRVVTNEAWATLKAGAGTHSNDSGAYLYSNRIVTSSTTNEFSQAWRSIALFDTSGLPDSASITDAILSLYGEYKQDGLNCTPDINIYSSNPASNTAVAAADFTSLGTTEFSTTINYADWNTAGYNDFALNASGIAAISKTGVSKFCARCAKYDVGALTPNWVASQTSQTRACSAEQGAGYKPKLVVTYTTGEAKTSDDTGSGVEFLSSRLLGVAEAGSALETSCFITAVLSGDSGTGSEVGGLLQDIFGCDAGAGADAFKALIGKSGSDMRLPGHQGQVGIPNKEVSI